MEKQVGIWIDTTRAQIVTLSGKEERITEVISNIENRIHHDDEGDRGSFMGTGHINHERTFDERKKHQIDAYLKDVLSKVDDADEIYVFGPGEVKKILGKMIHEDKQLASHLSAVETADSMTSHQVVAKVREYFHQLNPNSDKQNPNTK